jgi:NTE family protein
LKAQLKVATATKNFLYSLLVISFLFATACQTTPKKPTPRVITPTPSEPVITETPTPQATPIPEDFLHKKTPKVGIILGPGGMRTFAHVGVLKEFARAKIPIEAIAGLEWGALFAGLYAQQGQVNDLEWKALQMKETDVPGKGWLSSRVQPEQASVMNNYLNTNFGSTLIEKTKVPFSCATANLRQDSRNIWLARGSMRDAMSKCVPYLPFFKDNSGFIAAPFAIEEAANYLRSKGAQLIIFVNVLSEGALFPNRLISDYYAENVLWSEVRRQLSRNKLPGVHVIIPVLTSDKSLLDFDQRRFFMDAGSRAAKEQVNNLVSQYGF